MSVVVAAAGVAEDVVAAGVVKDDDAYLSCVGTAPWAALLVGVVASAPTSVPGVACFEADPDLIVFNAFSNASWLNLPHLPSAPVGPKGCLNLSFNTVWISVIKSLGVDAAGAGAAAAAADAGTDCSEITLPRC